MGHTLLYCTVAHLRPRSRTDMSFRLSVLICGIVLLSTRCFSVPVENEFHDADLTNALPGESASADPIVTMLTQSRASTASEEHAHDHALTTHTFCPGKCVAGGIGSTCHGVAPFQQACKGRVSGGFVSNPVARTHCPHMGEVPCVANGFCTWQCVYITKVTVTYKLIRALEAGAGVKETEGKKIKIGTRSTHMSQTQRDQYASEARGSANLEASWGFTGAEAEASYENEFKSMMTSAFLSAMAQTETEHTITTKLEFVPPCYHYQGVTRIYLSDGSHMVMHGEAAHYLRRPLPYHLLHREVVLK